MYVSQLYMYVKLYHVVFFMFGLEHLGHIMEVVPVGLLHTSGREGHGCVCGLSIQVYCVYESTCTCYMYACACQVYRYGSSLFVCCVASMQCWLELLSGRTTETQLPRNSLQAIEETTCNTGGWKSERVLEQAEGLILQLLRREKASVAEIEDETFIQRCLSYWPKKPSNHHHLHLHPSHYHSLYYATFESN